MPSCSNCHVPVPALSLLLYGLDLMCKEGCVRSKGFGRTNYLCFQHFLLLPSLPCPLVYCWGLKLNPDQIYLARALPWATIHFFCSFRVLICSGGWPWTRDPPASASQLLGFQANLLRNELKKVHSGLVSSVKQENNNHHCFVSTTSACEPAVQCMSGWKERVRLAQRRLWGFTPPEKLGLSAGSAVSCTPSRGRSSWSTPCPEYFGITKTNPILL